MRRVVFFSPKHPCVGRGQSSEIHCVIMFRDHCISSRCHIGHLSLVYGIYTMITLQAFTHNTSEAIKRTLGTRQSVNELSDSLHSSVALGLSLAKVLHHVDVTLQALAITTADQSTSQAIINIVEHLHDDKICCAPSGERLLVTGISACPDCGMSVDMYAIDEKQLYKAACCACNLGGFGSAPSDAMEELETHS